MNTSSTIINAVNKIESSERLTTEDITCWVTLKGCAYLSCDSIMCLPCCCFCGGCCGRYSPCIANLFPREFPAPGIELFQMTCFTQVIAAVLMPFTLCGCLWGCCGTCTPCARGIATATMGVEARSQQKVVVSPPQANVEMTR